MKELMEFFEMNGFVFETDTLDIYQKNKEGETPLHSAIRQGKIELAATMLSLAQEKLNLEIKKTSEQMEHIKS